MPRVSLGFTICSSADYSGGGGARKPAPQICSTEANSQLVPFGFSPMRTEVGLVKW
jgi:hypothetical protein